MTTIEQLKVLKERYGVGNMEICDLIGYNYGSINSWHRKPTDPTRTTLRKSILKLIEFELAKKYPKK